MEMPPKHTLRYALLRYLHEVKSATKQDCKYSLPHHEPQPITNALREMVLDGRIIQDGFQYSVHPFIANNIDRVKSTSGPITPPRVVNRLFCKPLTDYEASMLRNRRPGSEYPKSGYKSSETSINRFRGVEIK